MCDEMVWAMSMAFRVWETVAKGCMGSSRETRVGYGPLMQSLGSA